MSGNEGDKTPSGTTDEAPHQFKDLKSCLEFIKVLPDDMGRGNIEIVVVGVEGGRVTGATVPPPPSQQDQQVDGGREGGRMTGVTVTAQSI